MSQDGQRLEVEIALRGDIGSPTAEMKVSGEFDRQQVVRFDAAAEAVPDAVIALTVDLVATTIIDSAALGSLIRLKHSRDRLGCRVEVVVGRPFQVVVMQVGGLYDFLDVREVGLD